jgi:hypothetical protein
MKTIFKKLSICLLLFTIQSVAFASSVNQAFIDFFYSEEISPIHCGVNTQKFLKYLVDNNIKYETGFVVSAHQDYLTLNHFEARWGTNEDYENGVPYKRANYYFHVFAVIDGYAYDFSQIGPTVSPLKEYLEKVYLPAYPTKKIVFQGAMTRETELNKYMNMVMHIYNMDDYRKSMGPRKYSGVFIELFNL